MLSLHWQLSMHPTIDLWTFFKKWTERSSVSKKGYLLICVDFNVLPDASMDTFNPNPRRDPTMAKFIQKNAFYDVWCCHYPTECDYTFYSSVHNTYTRIDYFLVVKWILQKICESDIEAITWSNHTTVSITITNPTSPPPFKIWRANTTVMKSSTYAELLKKKNLEEFFQNNVGSVSDSTVLWNAHKAFIRGVLIQLSS